MRTSNLSYLVEHLVLMFLGAAAFALMHLFNAWLSRHISVSDHISWIYLPAFLRLMNVLVLGGFWGTLSTALGGVFLGVYYESLALNEGCNIAVSALSPLLAVWMLRYVKERPLRLTRMADLMQLNGIYALFNALFHHSLWALTDPAQLMSVQQFPVMVLGDFVGAAMGALLFARLARYAGLPQLLSRRAQED